MPRYKEVPKKLNASEVSPSMTEYKNLLASYQGLVDRLRQNAWTETEAENFEGTPERVMRLHAEMSATPDEIRAELNKQFQKVFPTEGSGEHGMVIQGPIILDSCCPHHLMPVRYHAYIAYIPKSGYQTRVLGLSKPTRVMRAVARRLVLQETLCDDLATLLYQPGTLPLFDEGHPPEFDLETDGAICTLVGVHTCMASRGAHCNAKTMQTSRRGSFAEDSTLEARFMQSVALMQATHPFD
jgi:GTP cyclohydrolase I